VDYGVFLPVANNGWIMSETAPQYMPTFELNKDICARAETGGFDFVLGMVKFRGYGGRTEMWDYAADSFTLLAGLAAATSTLRLYATVATLTMHPAVTARMAATIADISGGRFGVNVVSGWNKLEYSQMGLWPGDDFYRERYEYTTEYVDVMTRLWETGEVTHDGASFTLEDCVCKPVPAQRIPLVFAGQSERGMQLTAEYGDYNFMIGGTLDDLTALCDRLARAASKTGRTVGAYALFGIIAAATDEEAKSLAEHYLAGTDREAIANQTATADGDKSGTIGTLLGSERPMTPPVDFPDDTTPALVQGACFMAPQLIGSYDRIAHYLNELETRLGIAGVILTFPDFPAGVTEFAEQVLPRVQAAAPAESH
jgi:pyrimidine oxygenase